MKSEILLLLGAGFYIADTLHDGKYSNQFVKYKKHFKIWFISSLNKLINK